METNETIKNVDQVLSDPIKRSVLVSLPNQDRLNLGDYLLSNNGQYRITMQADGNLVLINTQRPAVALWASNTDNTHPYGTFAVIQNDGNLVIYNGSRMVIWASNTDTTNVGIASATMQDDGNFVVCIGKAGWATNTSI